MYSYGSMHYCFSYCFKSTIPAGRDCRVGELPAYFNATDYRVSIPDLIIHALFGNCREYNFYMGICVLPEASFVNIFLSSNKKQGKFINSIKCELSGLTRVSLQWDLRSLRKNYNVKVVASNSIIVHPLEPAILNRITWGRVACSVHFIEASQSKSKGVPFL